MNVPEAIVTVQAAMAPFRAYEKIMEVLQLVDKQQQLLKEARDGLAVVKGDTEAVMKRRDDLETDFSFLMKEFEDTKGIIERSLSDKIKEAKAEFDAANKDYQQRIDAAANTLEAIELDINRREEHLKATEASIKNAEATLSVVNKQIEALKSKLG